MVEHDAGIRVVDAVVDVVARLAVAERLADDPRDRGGGRGHQVPPRLGQDLDVLRKQPVDLGVDLLGQRPQRLHVRVIGHRESAADIEDLDLVAARESASCRTAAAMFRACTKLSKLVHWLPT